MPEMPANGIVLLAKQSGLTSFSSLFSVKHALKTKKVGHTGTLDSFAEGLLVVCVGNATHLVKYITEFDKEYEAVIKFGEETDTLELTGNIVRTADLPTFAAFKTAVEKWTGENEQIPPSFSAIHVDGKRLSDLAREGRSVEIPARKITVYKSEIVECRNESGILCTENDDKVLYAHVKFTVSKGTYIRSLARDIALDCASCAHLVALRRTRVGNFSLEKAAGAQYLVPFGIDSVLSNRQPVVDEQLFQEQIKDSVLEIDEETAILCGFKIVHLKEEYIQDFRNGKKLAVAMFESFSDFHGVLSESLCAVFCRDMFCGLVSFCAGKFSYCFVVPGQTGGAQTGGAK